ncbi:uncharacterized protein PG986_012631 [Apiospora aurea]|uniref:Uncharacterized protein n=1 Tax=Apiospora aurea TaxID=335848 RepID=A0ABR1Q0J4_9PEZI
MSGHEYLPGFLPYGALPDWGMSDYAFKLHRQLLLAQTSSRKSKGAKSNASGADDGQPRPALCAVCRSLRRLNCTHVSAKRCANLRPASKRKPAAPSKDEHDESLECYDFYACGDIFARGTYDELITDANRPLFRADRGDRRCADLCPLCWTEACWGERGAQRCVRLTVRAPLRLRRQRLIRQGKLTEDGSATEGTAAPDPKADTTIVRRVRAGQELKKWRVRGLMKGKVQVVMDEEYRIQRRDRRRTKHYDIC